jgi:hypothetical protein
MKFGLDNLNPAALGALHQTRVKRLQRARWRAAQIVDANG